MNINIKITLIAWVCFIGQTIFLFAQSSLSINIPDLEIRADKLIQGDADTYGRGDWKCEVTVHIIEDTINVTGSIIFSENEADRTIIKGDFRKVFVSPMLRKFQSCELDEKKINGDAGGLNFGSREPVWVKGKGLIKRIKIRTDTFGNDIGKIGGILKFNPIILNYECLFAEKKSLNFRAF